MLHLPPYITFLFLNQYPYSLFYTLIVFFHINTYNFYSSLFTFSILSTLVCLLFNAMIFKVFSAFHTFVNYFYEISVFVYIKYFIFYYVKLLTTFSRLCYHIFVVKNKHFKNNFIFFKLILLKT